MDVEKAVAVAAAEAEWRRDKGVSLRNKLWMYLLFLYFGFCIMMIVTAPKLAPVSSPDAAVPSLPACYDLRHRAAAISFAAVTVVMQVMLAWVLQWSPAPATKLTPLAAWPLGVLTWMFVTTFCLSYIAFGVRTYYSEWILAGVASALNLKMAACTVMNYLD